MTVMKQPILHKKERVSVFVHQGNLKLKTHILALRNKKSIFLGAKSSTWTFECMFLGPVVCFDNLFFHVPPAEGVLSLVFNQEVR